MKKKNPWRSRGVICRIMAAVMLLSATLTMMPLTVHADEPQVTADADYEAKKKAYREKLMADEITSDDLLIGSWVSFYSFRIDRYEYQLDQMAAAGINFNVFPRDFGGGAMHDASYWRRVENQYAKRNMVYFMNGDMNDKNVAVGVKYADGLAHCIGYHVVDEPAAEAFPEVGRLVSLYREADKTRYPFINLLPSYAPAWALGGTYREHVTNFVETVGAENIEYLSHDFYPFQEGGGVMNSIFSDMEVIRSVAYENGKLKTHAFPQSTAWPGTRMPTANEMRWNVYGYLAYGFKALTWFNLVCPGYSDNDGEGFYDSLIYRDGTIRDPELFAAFSELNWEVRGLSDVLMNLDTAHAYHTRRSGRLETLPEDYFIQPGSENDNFIISVMEPKEGEDHYVMIFNKNSRKDELVADFTVDLSGDVKGLEYFDPFIGEHIPVEIKDGVMKETFRAGEGRLYRLRTSDPTEETDHPAEVSSDPVTFSPVQTNMADDKDTTESGCNSVMSGGVLLMVLTILMFFGCQGRKREP